MADIGCGYGSEWHLPRYMGRHRDLLDARVKELVLAKAIRWLDFGFAPDQRWPDAESSETASRSRWTAAVAPDSGVGRTSG